MLRLQSVDLWMKNYCLLLLFQTNGFIYPSFSTFPVYINIFHFLIIYKNCWFKFKNSKTFLQMIGSDVQLPNFPTDDRPGYCVYVVFSRSTSSSSKIKFKITNIYFCVCYVTCNPCTFFNYQKCYRKQMFNPSRFFKANRQFR